VRGEVGDPAGIEHLTPAKDLFLTGDRP